MARSSSRSVKVYPSKVDGWFIGVMALSGIAAITGIVVAGFQEGPMRAAQGAFVLLGVIGLLTWIAVGTHYTLQGDELVVRSGPFSWRIPIAQITSVEKARGLMGMRSSPALSADRIVVHYGGKRLAISPADRTAFVNDLKARGAKL